MENLSSTLLGTPVGLMLNIQIDVMDMVRNEQGELATEGRFTAAATSNADRTILLLRVNDNHYHATGCQPIMPSPSTNMILPPFILSKNEYDKLFPNSEDKEQWSKATGFVTQYLNSNESQQLELKFEFEGVQAYQA